MADDDVVHTLLDRHGRTFADGLGLDLRKGAPSALFGLLLFAVLSSARIRSVFRRREPTSPGPSTVTSWRGWWRRSSVGPSKTTRWT